MVNKAIVLAGGTGSRLGHLTKVTNKHLLPVGDKPMIYHPVSKIIKANIIDICVVVGGNFAQEIMRYLVCDSGLDANFTFKFQKEASGIAGAIGLCEDFVNGEGFYVVLGDNIFSELPFVPIEEANFLFLYKHEHPEWFGNVEFNPESNTHAMKHIWEKPVEKKSDYIVTGIYFYQPEVFPFIKSLNKSFRGELEITDVNNYLLSEYEVYHEILDFWIDAGEPESLKIANDWAWENLKSL